MHFILINAFSISSIVISPQHVITLVRYDTCDMLNNHPKESLISVITACYELSAAFFLTYLASAVV